MLGFRECVHLDVARNRFSELCLGSAPKITIKTCLALRPVPSTLYCPFGYKSRGAKGVVGWRVGLFVSFSKHRKSRKMLCRKSNIKHQCVRSQEGTVLYHIFYFNS